MTNVYEWTRAEHLAWCKKRALEALDRGGATEAFVSMLSDLRLHPETAGHAGLTLGMVQLAAGRLNTQEAMRRHIEGYN